jgi:hypothetical protein
LTKSKCARLGIQKGRAKYFGEILSTGVFACFAPFEAKCNPGSNDLARLMNSAQNTNQKTNSNIFGRISESLDEFFKKNKIQKFAVRGSSSGFQAALD